MTKGHERQSNVRGEKTKAKSPPAKNTQSARSCSLSKQLNKASAEVANVLCFFWRQQPEILAITNPNLNHHFAQHPIL